MLSVQSFPLLSALDLDLVPTPTSYPNIPTSKIPVSVHLSYMFMLYELIMHLQ